MGRIYDEQPQMVEAAAEAAYGLPVHEYDRKSSREHLVAAFEAIDRETLIEKIADNIWPLADLSSDEARDELRRDVERGLVAAGIFSERETVTSRSGRVHDRHCLSLTYGDCYEIDTPAEDLGVWT